MSTFRIKTKQNDFAQIPAEFLPATPGKLALFETLCLAGLEDKWIRLSAAAQRAIMGSVVFGKQEFYVDSQTGEVLISRSTCFGSMKETQDYPPARIGEAIAAGKMLSPGTFGPNYL